MNTIEQHQNRNQEQGQNREQAQGHDQVQSQAVRLGASVPADNTEASPSARLEADASERVDMLGVARVAQAVDEQAFAVPGALKLVAPAKVNLYLEVGAKRPDGYHEVATVVHALALHDIVYMKSEPPCSLQDGAKPDQMHVHITMRFCEGVPAVEILDEENIVVKAVRALADAMNQPVGAALRVHVEKHIPAQAGMGGGSSDAAAALVGAAQLWGIDPADPRIEAVARTLGADVPFFLHGGCARFGGVGDELDGALEPLKEPVVMVKPQGGVSTAAAYRAFDEHPASIAARARDVSRETSRAADVPLCNNLTDAAVQILPEIADVLAWLQHQLGTGSVLLSGSGSAVFARCSSAREASAIASDARARGWWARSTSFSPLRAAIVPRR